MRHSSRLLIAFAGAAALTAVVAAPAHADTSATTATVAVQTGDLTILAPGTLDLSAVAPGASATGTSSVVVTDDRAAAVGWVTSASITPFTSGTVATTIPASAVSLSSGTATVTGTATVVPSDVAAGSGAVQTATDVIGNNTATWDQIVNVAIPSDALGATDYTATLTYSVL